MKYHICYADINDSHVLGNIHSVSFQTAYKDIIPDSILNNFIAEKREKYAEELMNLSACVVETLEISCPLQKWMGNGGLDWCPPISLNG